jgi:hypothetical protein
MRHQTANLRGGGLPIQFGDEASRQIYESEVETARAAHAARGVRFAVSPRVSVLAPSGKRYEAGTEITVALLHGGQRAAWALIQDWIHPRIL